MRFPRPGYEARLLRHADANVRQNDSEASEAAPWLRAGARKRTKKNWTDETWRMWHQKEPRELLEKEYDLPKSVFAVGKATRIYYSSDKWEEDGDFYTYYHDFDSSPTVYVSKKTTWGKDATGKALDVAKTLEMAHLHDQVRLPMLAKTLELIVDIDDEKETRKFRGDTPLCCTRDLKTLVIFASDGPIIIRGGKMVVTERGIVR